MSKLKLNGPDEYDSVTVRVIDHPIMYKTYLDDLINNHGWSEKGAKEWLKDGEVELELYYQPGAGIFAVESEAVESTDIFSPYTKEQYEDFVE